MESTPRLRPMSISDMLDAAFRLYRQHFLTFIGIVALLQVPMAIIQFAAQLPYLQALQRFTARPPRLAPGASPLDIFPFAQLLPYYALILGLSILHYLLVYNLMTGALANAISRSYLGQPRSEERRVGKECSSRDAESRYKRETSKVYRDSSSD